MKILELFAGSRSIGKEAEKLNYNVFSSDINNFDKIDYVVNILEFDYTKVPFNPDVIWASPPCTGFSVAALGHHWTGGKNAYIPKTDTAKLGIELAKKTI
jgi:site-specific DNA-cytosine methylase